MSSQTCKAHVALASWVNIPFLPTGVPASILEEARSHKTVMFGRPGAKIMERERLKRLSLLKLISQITLILTVIEVSRFILFFLQHL